MMQVSLKCCEALDACVRVYLSRHNVSSDQVFRYVLRCSLEGPWSSLVQQHTTMINFRAELDTAHEHARSTLIAATDQKIEDSRRASLAAIASFEHEIYDIQCALYQLAASLQSNCWLDPAMSGAILQRLQDWSTAEEQLKAAQQQLASLCNTIEHLDPHIGATDVRSATAPADQIEMCLSLCPC
jgi:hypothetical protein